MLDGVSKLASVELNKSEYNWISVVDFDVDTLDFAVVDANRVFAVDIKPILEMVLDVEVLVDVVVVDVVVVDVVVVNVVVVDGVVVDLVVVEVLVEVVVSVDEVVVDVAVVVVLEIDLILVDIDVEVRVCNELERDFEI